MKHISPMEMKSIMLDMLIQIDKYCKKNNIKYFLDSGTLLGAVRHKGYIPWDDDMDICMLRPDYDRFVELAEKEQIAPYVSVITPDQTPFGYIKIQDTRTLLIEYPDTLRLQLGIYVDVFPKDGHPDSELHAKAHCKITQLLGNMYWFNKYSVKVWKKQGNLLKKCIASIFAPFVEDRIFPIRLADRVARKYDVTQSKYCSSILAGGIRGRVPTKLFDSVVEVEFEGHKFPAMVGYDQYLRKLYENINDGDYMKLPPEEQKIIHDTEVYWKEGML